VLLPRRSRQALRCRRSRASTAQHSDRNVVKLYRRPDAPSYVLLPRRSRQALRCRRSRASTAQHSDVRQALRCRRSRASTAQHSAIPTSACSLHAAPSFPAVLDKPCAVAALAFLRRAPSFHSRLLIASFLSGSACHGGVLRIASAGT